MYDRTRRKDRIGRRSLVLLGLIGLCTATEPGWSASASGADSQQGAAARFTPTLDGAAVRDGTTGFVWEQEPDRFHGTWTEAAAHCREKTAGGRTGWRIPTVTELATLVDTSQQDPSLPPRHPFSNVRSAIYWTGSPSEKDDMVAWHISFFTGEAVTDQKSQTRRVWCLLDAPATESR